jgi:hypothetical protein
MGEDMDLIVIVALVAVVGFVVWAYRHGRLAGIVNYVKEVGHPASSPSVPPADPQPVAQAFTAEQVAAMIKRALDAQAAQTPQQVAEPVEVLKKMAGDSAPKYDFQNVITAPTEPLPKIELPEPPKPVAPPQEPLPPGFDEAYYRSRWPDVAEAIRLRFFASGADHYLKHGRAEGREFKAPVVVPVKETLAQYALRTAPKTGLDLSLLGALINGSPCPEGRSFDEHIRTFIRNNQTPTTQWQPKRFYVSASALLGDVTANKYSQMVNVDGKELIDGFGPPAEYWTQPDGTVSMDRVVVPVAPPAPVTPAAEPAGLFKEYASVALLLAHATRIKWGFSVLVDGVPIMGGFDSDPPAHYSTQPDGKVVRK